jgi:hypothetical protein
MELVGQTRRLDLNLIDGIGGAGGAVQGQRVQAALVEHAHLATQQQISRYSLIRLFVINLNPDLSRPRFF